MTELLARHRGRRHEEHTISKSLGVGSVKHRRVVLGFVQQTPDKCSEGRPPVQVYSQICTLGSSGGGPLRFRGTGLRSKVFTVRVRNYEQSRPRLYLDLGTLGTPHRTSMTETENTGPRWRGGDFGFTDILKSPFGSQHTGGRRKPLGRRMGGRSESSRCRDALPTRPIVLNSGGVARQEGARDEYGIRRHFGSGISAQALQVSSPPPIGSDIILANRRADQAANRL